ncbi:hypothetical protein [Streptomyces broussonetiae]|uniref:NAD-dependent epimerase/dehydratase family protein n=1 Tax=Streptomyces broussonetiae TaxID=2686304 RepID=A0ABV5EKP1_9ACTN
MTWLITGGAGYVGAHVVRAMTSAGERAGTYDDLPSMSPPPAPWPPPPAATSPRTPGGARGSPSAR